MAQTTAAMSWKDCKIEFSTDGSTYTDASGYANSVAVSGGERVTGAAYTTTGDTPIIKAGKRGPVTVTANVVYTETSSEFYDTANDAYEAASAFYLRWSPGGGSTGDLQYATSSGFVKSPVYPSGSADSGDPMMIDVVVEVASITEATVT
jgi:hypothetical protein